MREIEFRLYHKEREEMFYSNKTDFETKREFYPFEFAIGFSHYNQSDFSELMQFTGLTDKNGTKIFEGDVCKYKDFIDIWIVEFYQGAFFLTLSHGSRTLIIDEKECEVIGNIHQNKELLK